MNSAPLSLSPSTLPAALTVRPPWPDEIRRLTEAFPQFPLAQAFCPLVLVTSAGGVERLVGVAGIGQPKSGIATLSLAVRSRFLSSPALSSLIDAGTNVARTLGAHTLRTGENLPPADPRVAALKQHGFVHSRTEEIWRTAFAEMLPRLDRVHQRLESSGRLAGHTVTPLAESDLPEIRALMLSAGLLSHQRVFLLPASDLKAAAGHHAALSPVVRREGRLAGALLARVSNGTVIFEAQAVDPAWIGGFDVANHLTLRGVAHAGVAAGCTHMIFSANTEKASATVRMARRMNGQKLSEFVMLERQF